MSAGLSHSCALLVNDSLLCWGFGANGRLGYGDQTTIGDDELPSSAGAISLGGTAVQLSAGGDSTCTLLDTGAVRCFGANSIGQLGYAHRFDIGDDELPSDLTRVLIF